MNMTQKFYPYPLGVQYFEQKGIKGINAAFSSKERECGIVLFDQRTGEEVSRHPFLPENKVGRVYYQTITGIDPQKISYLFYEGERLIADWHAKGFAGKDVYGEAKDAEDYKAVLEQKVYDWGEDRLPQIPYEDCVAYCLHVRGFTRHSSSGVKAKGTFAGIIEKIPYLKELGITTLELQPVYEFNELPKPEKKKQNKKVLVKDEESKLNYWGYKEGFYYAPKRSYAKGTDACKECKDMIKALHENGMEAVLQFYFPEGVSKLEILEILRFWRFTYHADGFHLMGNGLPVKELAEDAYLSDCKLWYYDFPMDELYSEGNQPKLRKLATYTDAYMYDVRKLLKGDEGMLYEVMKRMRANPSSNGIVNYLTNYYGFTMMDMVSYEQKHNEDNGEHNKDGNDYNCSWNCGAEGATRKKQVLTLREKQLKNAFTFLMLSQGTPLFFMGDEFGNSQKGNNNPYCQDNEVAWLNWKDLHKNKALYEYVKALIAFRKTHSVFHQAKECMLMDYKSCGYPDLSYHGSEAWKPSWEYYGRHVGFMLCGEYAPYRKEAFYYVAINMHWEERTFALPKLPKGMKWAECLTTSETKALLAEEVQKPTAEMVKEEAGFQKKPEIKNTGIKESIYTLAPRSIAVFKGSK